MFTSRFTPCSFVLFTTLSSVTTGAMAAESTAAATDTAPAAAPATTVAAEPAAAPVNSPPPVVDTTVPAAEAASPEAQPAGNPPPVADKAAGASATAKASPLDGMRFEIGGRIGYAMPMGDATSGSKLDDYINGAIPLIVDAALRLKSGLGLGVYGGFGFGMSGSALDGCGDCSANMARFGVLLSQHFAYGGKFDPWVGAGIGADYLIVTSRMDYQGANYSVSSTYVAAPDLSLHAGLDVGSESLTFGPFASISYATYGTTSTDVTCDTGSCAGTRLELANGSIEDGRRSGHTWLMFGVRGTYMR